MLYTYSNKPMSMEILDQMQNFNYGPAAAKGTIQVSHCRRLDYHWQAVCGEQTGGGIYF